MNSKTGYSNGAEISVTEWIFSSRFMPFEKNTDDKVSVFMPNPKVNHHTRTISPNHSAYQSSQQIARETSSLVGMWCLTNMASRRRMHYRSSRSRGRRPPRFAREIGSLVGG